MAKVYVSDHALVRWLERVGGVDMDFFRDHISSLIGDAADAGAARVTVDGFVYLINTQRKMLSTILTPEMRASDRRARKVKNLGFHDRKYGDRDGIELGLLEMQEAE